MVISTKMTHINIPTKDMNNFSNITKLKKVYKEPRLSLKKGNKGIVFGNLSDHF